MKLNISALVIALITTVIIIAVLLWTAQTKNQITLFSNTTEDQLYTNEFGGFSFVLPEHYVISETSNCEGVCVELLTVQRKINDLEYENTGIAIQTSDVGPQNINDWFKANSPDIVEIENMTFAGVKARKGIILGLTGFSTYQFIKGNFEYSINFPDGTEPTLQNSILETFKFTR